MGRGRSITSYDYAHEHEGLRVWCGLTSPGALRHPLQRGMGAKIDYELPISITNFDYGCEILIDVDSYRVGTQRVTIECAR